MKYEPHEYQKYAIDYIETHPFAAVLLDMGLGKTSITLTAIGDLLFDSFEVSVSLPTKSWKRRTSSPSGKEWYSHDLFYLQRPQFR